MRLLPRDRTGFSIVELMVVISIIGILIGLSVPAFLGSRRRGQDRAAQLSAALALKIAKAEATDDGYGAVSVTTLQAAEPALQFLAADLPSAGPKQASVVIAGTSTFVVAVQSASGTCWWIKDVLPSPTSFAQTTGVCRAGDYLLVAADDWESSW